MLVGGSPGCLVFKGTILPATSVVSTGGPASEPPNRLVSSHDHERQSNAARFPAYTLNEHDRLGFIRDVASGDLSGADIASASSTVLHSLAARSFTDGYATLFAASAGF